MAIPAKPTLTTPPTAPVRGEDRVAFSIKANAYVAFIGTNVTDLNAAIDWQNAVFTAVESEADAAAQSVVDAAEQVGLAENETGLASTARLGAETAQSLSEEWATSLVVVSGGLRGAKYYADAAENSVATIPEGTINDTTVSLTGAWSSQKVSNEFAEGDFTRYDLASISTTAILDFATANVFTVDASVARTLTLANVPDVSRAMTAIVYVEGVGPVTWPGTIAWNEGVAPLLDDNWTMIVLMWASGVWTGASGASG